MLTIKEGSSWSSSGQFLSNFASSEIRPPLSLRYLAGFLAFPLRGLFRGLNSLFFIRVCLAGSLPCWLTPSFSRHNVGRMSTSTSVGSLSLGDESSSSSILSSSSKLCFFLSLFVFFLILFHILILRVAREGIG